MNDERIDKAEARDLGPIRRANLNNCIEHFTWPWFACTMSTGSLAVVLGQTPNRFKGLLIIGKIVYVMDLVLFLLLATLIGARLLLFPRKFIASIRHSSDGLQFGTFWVSISLIINGAQIYGVPISGAWLVSALKIVFWLYCAIALITAIFQYSVFFRSERFCIEEAMPAWIFPVYPLLVVGTTAGTLIPSQPPHAAYTMWIGAVMLQGLAWTVSFMIYVIYLERLMTSDLPSPSSRPGIYISVGPAGYTSAGFISLGMQAANIVPENAVNLTVIPDGDVLKVLGVACGAFLVLFSVWFFFISTVLVLGDVRRMSFTLAWWAFVFPNAGLALAAIELGKAFKSPAIDGICSALTVVLVIAWVATALAHIRALWRGDKI